MRYTLIWRPTAEAALAHLWNMATDRQAVTDAADAIDTALRNDPLLVGESRGGDTRIVSSVLPKRTGAAPADEYG